MAAMLRLVAATAIVTAVLCPSTLASVVGQPIQHTFASPEAQSSYSSRYPWTSLSHAGLSINSPPGDQYHGPRYLTLSTLSQAELDPSTALLHFGEVHTRRWADVMQHCGHPGGIESCEKDDLLAAGSSLHKKRGCKPIKGTVDGRAIFDPEASGCEPLQKLWKHLATEANPQQSAELLSFTAHLEIEHLPTSLRNGTHEDTFWLAHLLTGQRAAWPLSNDLWFKKKKDHGIEAERDEGEDERWQNGTSSNKIAGLMQDPYLPRTTNPKNGDTMNGVDTTEARW